MPDFVSFVFRMDGAGGGMSNVTVWRDGVNVSSRAVALPQVGRLAIALGVNPTGTSKQVTATFDSIDVIAK
jgi:hypothetical protein